MRSVWRVRSAWRWTRPPWVLPSADPLRHGTTNADLAAFLFLIGAIAIDDSKTAAGEFLLRARWAAENTENAWVDSGAPANGIGFKTQPHMLRHACGFALANKGHDMRALQAYLGHKNIQHTVRYTELSPDRFKDFWR